MRLHRLFRFWPFLEAREPRFENGAKNTLHRFIVKNNYLLYALDDFRLLRSDETPTDGFHSSNHMRYVPVSSIRSSSKHQQSTTTSSRTERVMQRAVPVSGGRRPVVDYKYLRWSVSPRRVEPAVCIAEDSMAHVIIRFATSCLLFLQWFFFFDRNQSCKSTEGGAAGCCWF